MTTWTPARPLDLAACTARFTRWGNDPVNVVVDGAFHRCIMTASGPVVYRATQHPSGEIAVMTADERDEPTAMADLRTRLAEGLPAGPLEELATHDDRVSHLVRRFPGYRPPITPDPFESLISSISAQQVNLRWALTTRRRLVERYGHLHLYDGIPVWEFPKPEVIGSADPGEIRALQFTTRKAEFIVGVGQATTNGALDHLDDLPNEVIVERLTAIRGIGRWSAEWLLARCLARPDVVAAGDLGVRKAVSFSYLANDDILSESVVRDTALAWGDAANWTAHLLLETLVA